MHFLLSSFLWIGITILDYHCLGACPVLHATYLTNTSQPTNATHVYCLQHFRFDIILTWCLTDDLITSVERCFLYTTEHLVQLTPLHLTYLYFTNIKTQTFSAIHYALFSVDGHGQYRGTFLVPVPSVLWKKCTGTAVPVLSFLNF